jgi:hypothetical protein
MPRPLGIVDSALEVKELVVDGPATIELEHTKGVDEHHAEVGLAKTYACGVTGDIARQDLQSLLGTCILGRWLLRGHEAGELLTSHLVQAVRQVADNHRLLVEDLVNEVGVGGKKSLVVPLDAVSNRLFFAHNRVCLLGSAAGRSDRESG